MHVTTMSHAVVLHASQRSPVVVHPAPFIVGVKNRREKEVTMVVTTRANTILIVIVLVFLWCMVVFEVLWRGGGGW